MAESNAQDSDRSQHSAADAEPADPCVTHNDVCRAAMWSVTNGAAAEAHRTFAQMPALGTAAPARAQSRSCSPAAATQRVPELASSVLAAAPAEAALSLAVHGSGDAAQAPGALATAPCVSMLQGSAGDTGAAQAEPSAAVHADSDAMQSAPTDAGAHEATAADEPTLAVDALQHLPLPSKAQAAAASQQLAATGCRTVRESAALATRALPGVGASPGQTIALQCSPTRCAASQSRRQACSTPAACATGAAPAQMHAQCRSNDMLRASVPVEVSEQQPACKRPRSAGAQSTPCDRATWRFAKLEDWSLSPAPGAAPSPVAPIWDGASCVRSTCSSFTQPRQCKQWAQSSAAAANGAVSSMPWAVRHADVPPRMQGAAMPADRPGTRSAHAAAASKLREADMWLAGSDELRACVERLRQLAGHATAAVPAVTAHADPTAGAACAKPFRADTVPLVQQGGLLASLAEPSATHTGATRTTCYT